MLIVRCKNANSAERELIEALSDLDGVAFIGYKVAQGEREREVDALVFTPVRAVAIEVKAPKLATPREGELVPRSNGPWTINGEKAEFYGGNNPSHQARLGAQVFASFLRESMEATPFIQVAVAIADAELVMSKGPVMVGQTAVSLTSQVLKSLDQMKKKPIPLEMALEMIEVMNLGVLTPRREDIEAEWRRGEAREPKPPVEQKSLRKPRKKELVERDKSPFDLFMAKFSDAFNTATVIFLFLWFLYTIGLLDAGAQLLQEFQDLLGSAFGG